MMNNGRRWMRFAAFACLLAVVGLAPDLASRATAGLSPVEIEDDYVAAYTRASGKAARKVALIIGNDRYRESYALRNAVSDARSIERKLRQLGFETNLVTDADNRRMNEAIQRLAGDAAAADVALFFYSGHAVEFSGANYIFGIDIPEFRNEEDVRSNGLPLTSVLSIMEQGAPIRLLILDACRSSPFQAAVTGSRQIQAPNTTVTVQKIQSPAEAMARSALLPGGISPGKGLAAMRGRSGTYIAYAAEPGRESLDGEAGDTNSPFTKALLNYIDRAGLTIEQIFNEVRRSVFLATNGKQLPWAESALLGSLFMQPPPLAVAGVLPRPIIETGKATQVEDADLVKTLGSASFKISGQGEATAKLSDGMLVLADGHESDDVLRRGVNYITQGETTIPAWYERRKLVIFPAAYRKSYAVVSAVGAYGPKARDRYQDMGILVAQAKKFAGMLLHLGFPAENITTLFDADATSVRLEQELRRFWPGGDRADADRLLFYFGGHGDHVDIPNYLTFVKDQQTKRGLLVTHDHDPKRPLATSFLLDDIIQRHFAFLAPRHVLFLIDSCSSGLALPRMADGSDTTVESVMRYQQLALLDSELKGHARNLLVASSGDAKALYQNGGLFTKVLIEAIETRTADLNRDGLIQFDELNLHVSNLVKVRSKELGLEQSPSPFRVGSNFIFVLPAASQRPN